MRKKWLVLLLAGLVVAGLAGSAAAYDSGAKTPRSQGRKFVGKGWTGKHTVDRASRLGLTAEQKEKIANLKLSFKEETLDLRTELTRKKLEMQKLLLEESPDLTRVYALVDEMAPIQAEIQKKAIEFRFKLKDLFTEEQLDKFPGLGLGPGFGKTMGHRGAMAGHGCWR
jgi:Spy/CpxP family protein refolding chaperone